MSPIRPRTSRFEFGYLYVDPDHRGEGLGAALVDKALSLVGSDPIFATTRFDNKAMRHMLPERSFKLLGKKYPSEEDPARFLCLYARPASKAA